MHARCAVSSLPLPLPGRILHACMVCSSRNSQLLPPVIELTCVASACLEVLPFRLESALPECVEVLWQITKVTYVEALPQHVKAACMEVLPE